MTMRRRFLPLIYMIPLATLLVRVVWLARFPGDPLAPVDAEGYHLLACNLLAGRGFSMVKDPPFCPASVRVPLYPLFLAGTYGVLGTEPGRAVLVQLLLEVVTAALVMRLAREVAGGRIALLAGLFYAFNGTTQRYVGVLYSEIFLLPLIVVALWASARALKITRPCAALAAGGLWGLAILTKPNVQYLALAVGGLVFMRFLFVHESRRRAIAAGLAFFGILALVLAPWVVRNRLVFDRWMVSTAFEENLARVSAPATLAEARKLRVAPWTPTWEALYGELLAEASARYDWDARGEYE
ncbi:MAG: ArnT family glycosyltransferase, partial [Anaerolineae bacterium]